MQNKLSVGECFRFGWETFKKRPWFLIGVLIVTFIVSAVINYVAGLFGTEGMGGLLGFLVSFGASTLLGMGTTAFLLKAHDSIESAKINLLWHPQSFVSYLVSSIVLGVAAVIGFILLIVPGIIIILTYQFGQYIIIDRNLGPIEALKESARITKGSRMQLFVLLLALVGVNILGALALGIGLLVTIPISMLAMVHAYRTLEHKASEVSPVTPMTPVTPVTPTSTVA